MQPHQRDVTSVLAAAIQSSHEQLPPEMIEPLIKNLVTHFVSDKSRPEVITLGLNTIRELCMRVPLAMDSTLLTDLVDYRREKVQPSHLHGPWPRWTMHVASAL